MSIAVLAQANRDMAAGCEAQDYRQAEKVLNAAIAKTYQRYPHLEDEDITRTLLVAQKYQELLRNYERQSSKNDR